MTPEADLKAEIANLKELLTMRLALLERITGERCAAHSTALKIQADEYARRLGDLNGEAERLRQMQMTYLPREIYEASQAEVIKRVDELRRNNSLTEGKTGSSESWSSLSPLSDLSLALQGLS